MSRMIQIRNVPDELHRELKVRAARSGRSLSDYLLAELRRIAGRPTMADLLRRIQRRGRVRPSAPAADIVRETRDEE